MEKRFETRELPTLYTRAKVGSIDTEKRTFDVVFATNSEVPMWNFDRGAHLEILDMNPESVRLDRINSGAPLLDNHDSYSGTRAVLGAVVKGSAKVDGERATATVKMSKRQDVEGTWQDIQDGILSTISVGYSVHKAELIDSERKVYRATDWTPFEISIAPIPADTGATIREQAVKTEAQIEVIDEVVTTDLTDTNEDFTRDYDYIMTLQARYKNY